MRIRGLQLNKLKYCEVSVNLVSDLGKLKMRSQDFLLLALITLLDRYISVNVLPGYLVLGGDFGADSIRVMQAKL